MVVNIIWIAGYLSNGICNMCLSSRSACVKNSYGGRLVDDKRVKNVSDSECVKRQQFGYIRHPTTGNTDTQLNNDDDVIECCLEGPHVEDV